MTRRAWIVLPIAAAASIVLYATRSPEQHAAAPDDRAAEHVIALPEQQLPLEPRPTRAAPPPAVVAPAATAGVSPTVTATVPPACPLHTLFPDVFADPDCVGSPLGSALAHVAGETHDAAWAETMEARIREALGLAERLAANRAEIVCRTTSCAILLVHDGPDSMDAGARAELRSQLAGDLGFSSRGTSSGFQNDLSTTVVFLGRAQGRERYLPPETPTSRRVPALPNLAGFDLRVPPTTPMQPGAEALARETADPVWAAAMESRIFGAVAALGTQFAQMHVECRSTMCGIVLAQPPGTAIGSQHVIAEPLSETLGFGGASTMSVQDPDRPFVAIYLRDPAR